MKEHSNKTKFSFLFILLAICSFTAGVIVCLYFPFSKNHSNQIDPKNLLINPSSIDSNQQTKTNHPSENPSLSSEQTPPVNSNEITNNGSSYETLSEDKQESMKRYKKMLEKSVESSRSKNNSFFNYGIVIGSYTSIDKANEKAIDLHTQYEDWNITTQEVDNFYKVVIGTFTTKEEAQNFLNNMPKKS